MLFMVYLRCYTIQFQQIKVRDLTHGLLGLAYKLFVQQTEVRDIFHTHSLLGLAFKSFSTNKRT